MKRCLRLLLAILLGCLAPTSGRAQPMGGGPELGGGPPGRPVFLDELFPPMAVMRSQEAIGLTAAQREAIQQAMRETQAKLVDLQWRLEADQEKLTKLLAAPRIDETAALAAVEQVMGLEQQVKRLNLGLLIRIKNQLTPAQQEQLRKLRPLRGGPPGPPRPGGPDQ